MSSIIENKEVEEVQILIDENNKQKFFSKIQHSELEGKESIEDEISSFDNIPILFNGINTSTFGLSSNFVKNPFLKLVEIVKREDIPWEDKTQGLRYMQRIPHINRKEHCIDCAINIITDSKFPLDWRYHFFSNNERIIKLDYDIVNACHHYFFFNFEKFNSPLLYRILSSQYLLSQFPLGTYDSESVQSFLISVAKDENMEVNYRAECSDILDRIGYGDNKKIGTDMIIKLGDLYLQNKKRTIYTNSQNVHDTSINKGIIEVLRNVIKTTSTERNSEEIYNLIIKKIDGEKKEQTIEVFQRIIIDTAKYEGLPMCDIMMLIWEKICNSEHKDVLEDRMLEEMYEMYKTCSTGHLSRLINVLSGFFSDINPVKISYKDQLRSNVFARLSASIKTLGVHEQEEIINEISSETKCLIEDFLFSYSPKDELYEEFVIGKYLNEEEFSEIYSKSEKEYFGMK